MGLARGVVALMGGWCLLHAAAAAAQTGDAADSGSLFGWSVAASLQARLEPNYMGSKTYTVGPGGSLAFYRTGDQPVFGAPDDSPSLQLLGNRDLSGGVLVQLQSSRGDHGALRGFDKIDWTIEPGLYANWWATDWLRLRAEVRRGIRSDIGWTSDLGADLVQDNAKWLLSLGPRVHLGDSRFSRTYFGVTTLEAARSPFAITPFGADGVFTSFGALASVEYRWTRRWSILADADYRRIAGTAADSPIVARLGSKDQITTALGVRYAFGR